MKKLICIVLAGLTLLLMGGCGKKGEESSSVASSNSYDIVALASKGEIPELNFKLGSNIEELKKKYQSDFSADQTKPELQIMEGQLTVKLDIGTNSFHYEKAKAANGISAIACMDSIYGFSIGGGVRMEDVKPAIKKTPVEADATANDLFFLPAATSGYKMLKYDMGSYILKLFFANDILSATVLYDPANWSN